jgi:uncharacterized membrane protein
MTSDVSTVHERIDRGRREHPARKGAWFSVVVTAVEIGGSIGLFQLAQHLGASDIVSYLVGSIGPVVGGILVWVRARAFSGASAAIFGFTMVSALIALIGSTSPKVLLYKDCAATGLIGLIFLGSCLVSGKPIVFYMAQRYGTDGTHEGMAVFDMMWDAYREFRRSMYVTSGWWGVVFLIQAGVTALIIRASDYSTGYTYDQTLPLVAVGLGIVGSIVLGRYFTRRGRARQNASAAG